MLESLQRQLFAAAAMCNWSQKIFNCYHVYINLVIYKYNQKYKKVNPKSLLLKKSNYLYENKLYHYEKRRFKENHF
jgi:hypothetical protein